MEQIKMQLGPAATPRKRRIRRFKDDPLMRDEIAALFQKVLTDNRWGIPYFASLLGASKSTVDRIVHSGGNDRRNPRGNPHTQNAVIAEFFREFGDRYPPPARWQTYALGVRIKKIEKPIVPKVTAQPALLTEPAPTSNTVPSPSLGVPLSDSLDKLKALVQSGILTADEARTAASRQVDAYLKA